MKKNHEKWMKQALDAAEKGAGWVNPNPLVGAVIVRDSKVIATGYHKAYGEDHAEVDALKQVSGDLSDAQMYVTLEPCNHQGKTPACTQAIIESGIKEVFVSTLDPNPKVAGQGVAALERHGIKVHVGILEEEGLEKNAIFFYAITHKQPYVTLKYAMTLDGKIATSTKDSKWITSEEARKHVHEQRRRHQAIMVGVNTVLADDPLLTARLEGAYQPIRIICDSKLSTPMDAKVIQTVPETRTILATSSTDIDKRRAFEDQGIEIITVEQTDEGLSLDDLFNQLYAYGIDSIYVEGGASIHGSLIHQEQVQAVHAYVAPKIVGGEDALSPIAGKGISKMVDAFTLEFHQIKLLGQDLFLESRRK